MFKKIMLIVLSLCVNTTFAQMSLTSKKVSVYTRDNDICALLDRISTKSGVNFTYNSDLLRNSNITNGLSNLKYSVPTETYRCSDCEISDVLDDVLPQNLAYTIAGNNIVIYERQNVNNENSKITISGNIYDSQKKEPLPFATISLNNSFIGTISDENGNFKLSLIRKNLDDSLTISYLGYYNQTISVKQLVENGKNKVVLEPKTYCLPQVVVSPKDVTQMINDVAAKAKSNYDRHCNVYKALYRESYYTNSAFIARAEAETEILKPAGTDFSKTKISITKGKKMVSKQMPDMFLKLRGGPYNYMDMDFVNRSKEFAGPNGTKYYDYYYAGIDTVDSRQCNVVEFSKKEKYALPKYNGKMFIDCKTKALAKLEFSEIPDSIVRQAKNKSGDTIAINFVKLSYIVNYKFVDGIWYLQNCIGTETRKITEKNGDENYITSISQLLITEITGRKSLQKNAKLFSRKDIFWDF